MADWDADAWDTATTGEFAEYNEAGILEIQFTSNEFRQADQPDRFGRYPFEFAVIQNHKPVSFEIGSLRLMRKLKSILPLENKRVRIIRTGTGMATEFEVEVIE